MTALAQLPSNLGPEKQLTLDLTRAASLPTSLLLSESNLLSTRTVEQEGQLAELLAAVRNLASKNSIASLLAADSEGDEAADCVLVYGQHETLESVLGLGKPDKTSTSSQLGAMDSLDESAERARVKSLCSDLGISQWQEQSWVIESSKILRASSCIFGTQNVAFLGLCIG